VQRAHVLLAESLVNAVEDGLDLTFAVGGADDKIVSDERDRADVQQDNVFALLVRDDVNDDMSQFGRFQCLISWSGVMAVAGPIISQAV
jgi:hypothetical protein